MSEKINAGFFMNSSTVRLKDAQDARSDYYHELMNAYRVKSNNLQGRKIEFLDRNRSELYEALAIIGTGALCGGTAGGVVGAIAGGALGIPGGPLGMGVGAGIGFGVGFGVGTAIGAGVATYRTYPKYLEWCQTETGKEFGLSLRVFLEENKILEHLSCSITMAPVIDGVRDKDGRLYERWVIEQIIEQSGRNPFTNVPMTKSELVADENVSTESVKVFIKFLIQKRDETIELAPEFQEGYDKLIKDMRQAFMNVYNMKLAIVQKKFNENRIDYDEFCFQTQELSEKYLRLR
jgi:hypothetical protein